MLRTGARGAGTGGGVQALRGALVAAEVALAVTLVAGAGLLGRSFARLGDVELGFEPARVLVVKAGMKTSRFPDGPAYQFAIDQALARIAALPGVTSVAVAKDAPLRGAAGEEQPFALPEEQDTRPQHVANLLPVSPGWFRTMGVALRAGRDLRDPEDSLTGAVVVSEALARATWPGRSPLGRELVFDDRRLTVVGVAADVRWTRVDSVPPPMIYLSRRIMRRSGSSFVVRTAGDPAAMIPAVRAAIREVNPDQAFQFSGTMRDVVAEATAAPRFLMVVVTSFGALALLLAAIGIYGVVAYVVGQRTRDIGVRVALGANARDIAGWTLRTAMVPVVAGIAGGLAASLLLARAIRGQLYEVSATDPTVLAGVVIAVVAVSLVATAVPARRAMLVDPVDALRRE
jgi:predicted permease